MSTLRLPGLGTGIDTRALITQLMSVERRTLRLYEQRQMQWNDRKDALRELQSRLDSLRTAVKSLSDSRELRTYATASNNTDVLTATASHNASEGNHTIVVNQLANAERWVHTAGKDHAESLVGAGTFIYSYNHQEMVVTTTVETTLEDLVGLINNNTKNPGVTANLLFYNGAYHLTLSGNNPGSDFSIRINDSNTEVWQAATPLTARGGNPILADKIRSLDQFSGTFAGDEIITISGATNDGTAVSRTMVVNEHTTLDHLIKEINTAFSGTAKATLVNGQIRLTDHTSGASQMTLALTYDAGSGTTELDLPVISQLTQGGSVMASLGGFGDADFTQTQAAQDSQIKVDGFPPGAEQWITRSSNKVEDVLRGVTLNLSDTGTAQVSVTRDTQSIKGKLNAVINAYNGVTRFLKDKAGYNDSLKRAGVLMSNLAIYNISVDLQQPLMQQARGFVADVDKLLTPGHIGLQFDQDGMLSLTASQFDEAIAQDYLGVLALIGARKTGGSDSNAVEFYGASERYTTAGTYSVEVTVSEGAITAARIKRADESDWRDATFSGSVVMGNSDFDENGRGIHPENGLQLRVDLSQDGTFTATVRVRQGFAGAMEDALDRVLKTTTGVLPLDQSHVDNQIRHLKERIELEQTRLAAREKVLVARFTRMEKSLALLQNQMAALGLQY
jgi:flagellar capping protein FliD